MSYTLRGRVESRLAALVPVLLGRVRCSRARSHRWWPVELVGADGGRRARPRPRGLAPAAPVPAGLGDGAARRGRARRADGDRLRLRPARAARRRRSRSSAPAGSLVQLLAQAGFPLLRLGYAEDGGELGRLGAGRGGRRRCLALVGSAATCVRAAAAGRPRSRAGVHQGPLVITQREMLAGRARARSSAAASSSRTTTSRSSNVTVIGGKNGITVDGVRRHRPRRRDRAGREARRHPRPPRAAS